MSILIDMNLSPRWVEWLSQCGVAARHWSTIGESSAPDDEIMAYAAANALIVVTQDLDFAAILSATGGRAPSVVQIRADDASPEQIGAQVVAALQQLAVELADGALVSIEPARRKVRVLPLPGAGRR